MKIDELVSKLLTIKGVNEEISAESALQLIYFKAPQQPRALPVKRKTKKKAGRPCKHGQGKVYAVCRDYENGMKLKDIAEKNNVPRGSVHALLKRGKIKIGKRG